MGPTYWEGSMKYLIVMLILVAGCQTPPWDDDQHLDVDSVPLILVEF